MVVHSDPLIVAYLAEILNEFNCDLISTTPRLDDAKREALASQPDIAFIDAELADGNKGYRLAVHLAAKYNASVIMMSHDLENRDITSFDGTFHWVRMPYSENEITEELGQAIRDRFRAASLTLSPN
jgi:DNA-binding response OmpR family regulator